MLYIGMVLHDKDIVNTAYSNKPPTTFTWPYFPTWKLFQKTNHAIDLSWSMMIIYIENNF